MRAGKKTKEIAKAGKRWDGQTQAFKKKTVNLQGFH